MTKVIECLSSKQEALSLNPSTTRKKRKEKAGALTFVGKDKDIVFISLDLVRDS
jgi:hypothetical protein